MFRTREGAELDILVTRSRNSRFVLLVYPCIGGTTRSYGVPHEQLVGLGAAVVEYHPPQHGRSTGQMAMGPALQDLYHYLSTSDLAGYPVIAIGHSAGCNALLHISTDVLPISRYYLVQPVFNVRESMLYMYRNGTEAEFIAAISRWSTDIPHLRDLLGTPDWLKPTKWFGEEMREDIDRESTGLRLGHFLEDFYIPGYDSTTTVASLSSRLEFVMSRNDTWYPIQTSIDMVLQHHIPLKIIDQAADHYLFGVWRPVWDYLLPRIAARAESMPSVEE